MFGVTPSEITNSGGVAPDPNNTSMRPSSFGENMTDLAVSRSMGHGSELGANILGSQELQNQYDAIRKHDPAFADSLPNPGYAALPDIIDGLATGKPKVGTFASKLAGMASGGANRSLQDAIKGQQMIEEWRKSHPEATDIPDLNTLKNNVKFRQDTLDQEAAESDARSAAVNLPLLGRVSGAGLVGGILASTQISNPAQAAFNLFLGAGGLGKEVLAGAGQRIAANAVANGVVSAVSQSIIAAPAAEQYGVQRDYKQEAFGVLTNMLFGGILSGAHETYSHYFPATTKPAMQEVRGAVDEVKTQGGPIGDVVKDLATAKNPDELQAKVAALPLETRLDVLHEVSPAPSAEERGVIQAGEKELVIEKGGDHVGLDYPAAADHAVEVSKAIDSERPVPETPLAGNEKLPSNLAGAKPRWGYQERNGPIQFESDIDKALYITAQKTPSKADALYRAFLKQNGMTDEQIRIQGAALKDKIKNMAKDSPSGQLTVSKGEPIKPSASAAVAPTPPGPKFPVRAWLRRQGGVRTGSVLAQELNSIGLNNKTAPGLFRNMGKLTDVDNIPHSEWDLSHAPKDETGNYVDRQYILNALESEIKGKPITNQERIPEEARLVGPEPGSKEDLERYAQSLGVDTEGKSVEDALAEIRAHEARLEAVKDEVDTIGLREEENEKADAIIEAKYQAIEEKVAPVEKTAAGDQSVIPGAEKIPDKQLAERKMEGGMKSDKPQKGADEGLFDVAGRAQEDMFSNLKPKDAAPIDEEKSMTVKDAIDEIRDHDNLIKAMTTCSIE